MFFNIKNVRVYKINLDNYKGRKLSDAQIDILENVSYPNGKHKLYKFNTKDWFKPNNCKSRDKVGRFKSGSTPWNKNLHLKIIKDGNSKKTIVVGTKKQNEKKT